MSIPERFTDDSRKAMAMAYRESLRLDSEYIGTEHILLGLLAEGKGHAAQALGGRGVDIEKARREVDKMARDVGPELGYKRPLTPRAKGIVERAIEEARRFKMLDVNAGHLLLGLLSDRDSVACQVLMNLSVDLEGLGREVEASLEAGDAGEQKEDSP